jgi:hypothetical protein
MKTPPVKDPAGCRIFYFTGTSPAHSKMATAMIGKKLSYFTRRCHDENSQFPKHFPSGEQS